MAWGKRLFQAAPSLLTKLIAYYALSDANDSSGNGRNLTNTGSVTFGTPSKVGNAGQFTAASSMVLSSADAGFGLVGGITLAAWVRFASFPGANSNFVDKAQSTPDSRGYAVRYNNVADRIIIGVYHPSGDAEVNWSAAPAANTWYFVVGWYDLSAATVNLSIDNAAAVSAAAPNGPGIATSPCRSSSSGDGTLSFLDGALDEVGIWNRVLTAAERSILYNGTAGVTWPLV